MKELQYPFEAEYILRKRKSIKKELLRQKETSSYLTKRIAVLGGSTTYDVKEMLEIFLLDRGIAPVFYESGYNQYWQEIMFESQGLAQFQPDIIYIHTSSRNIHTFPTVKNTEVEIDQLLDEVYGPFEEMWKKAEEAYHCPIIQNNFELPFYRLLGNMDASDYHGRISFVNRLNEKFYAYARVHSSFFINDIHYLASCYGIQRWADPFYWYMYKYACAVPAIPELAYNIANIVKSIYGKNKKALVLDLDNTIWGGVVGEDGPEHIEIGPETPAGQAYSEFQSYIKAHKNMGVLLAVASKNDKENALAGLGRPDNTLRPEDFLSIKSNWDDKDKNIAQIAQDLNIGLDSLVFVDDNPAERHLVTARLPEVEAPELGVSTNYMQVLDRSGFFEMTYLSQDDLERNQMYQDNVRRERHRGEFENYTQYLKSLQMSAEIQPFIPMYTSRIAQLTNKSNQFNLTTKRYRLQEIEEIAKDPFYITLYGKLKDRFGDNGVVSVIIGRVEEECNLLHIDLWLMSCRVLKRGMEFAMMDALIEESLKRGIGRIRGYYYPTKKNGMVCDFYRGQGFKKVRQDEGGATVWEYLITGQYKKKNTIITIEK